MKRKKIRVPLAIVAFVLICFCSLLLFGQYIYNTTLLFDASKQKSRTVDITYPNRKYTDHWLGLFLACGRNFVNAAPETDRYLYPPDLMLLIRNKLKENLIIETSDGTQSLLQTPSGGEAGVSADEIAHITLDPYPKQKTTYKFRLKNPGVFRGIACDIYVRERL